ncbi:hypothetical protein ACJX0J_020413, partial [Zea mays]
LSYAAMFSFLHFQSLCCLEEREEKLYLNQLFMFKYNNSELFSVILYIYNEYHLLGICIYRYMFHINHTLYYYTRLFFFNNANIALSITCIATKPSSRVFLHSLMLVYTDGLKLAVHMYTFLHALAIFSLIGVKNNYIDYFWKTIFRLIFLNGHATTTGDHENIYKPKGFFWMEKWNGERGSAEVYNPILILIKLSISINLPLVSIFPEEYVI